MPEFYPSALITDVSPGLISANGGVEITFTGTFPVGTAINGWIGWTGDDSDFPLYSGQEGRGASLISSDGVTLSALTPRLPVGDVVITLKISGEYHHYIDAKISPPLVMTKPITIKQKFQPVFDLGSRGMMGESIYQVSDIPIVRAETPLYVGGSGGQVRKLDTSGWHLMPSLPGGHAITAIKALAVDKLLAGSPTPSNYGSLWLLESGTWTQIWTPPYHQYGIEDFPLISLHNGSIVAGVQRNGANVFGLGVPPSISDWSVGQVNRPSAAYDGTKVVCIDQYYPPHIYYSPTSGPPAWVNDLTIPSGIAGGNRAMTIDRATGNFLFFVPMGTGNIVSCYEGIPGAWSEAYSLNLGQLCSIRNMHPFLVRDNGDVYFSVLRSDQYSTFFRRINGVWSVLHRQNTTVWHNAGWFNDSAYFPISSSSSIFLKLTGDTFSTVDISLGTSFNPICCSNWS